MPIPVNNPKHNARNPTERRAQQNQRGLLHMPERNARPRSAESTGARLRRAQQNQRGIARPTSPLSAQVCQCGLRLSAPKSVGPVGRFITDCVCVSQLAMPRPSDPTPAYSKRCLQSVCSDPLAMPCLSHPAMLYRFLPRLAPHLPPLLGENPRKVLGARRPAKHTLWVVVAGLVAQEYHQVSNSLRSSAERNAISQSLISSSSSLSLTRKTWPPSSRASTVP